MPCRRAFLFWIHGRIEKIRAEVRISVFPRDSAVLASKRVKIARQRLRYRDRRSRLEPRFEFLWLAVQGPALEGEFRFHPTRKWRSDFAQIPSRTLF